MSGKRSGRIGLRRASNAVTALLLLFLLHSCDGVLLHKYEPVADGVWLHTDTLVYMYCNTRDSVPADNCSLLLEARVNASFLYKELCMEVTAEGNNGFRVSDTLRCIAYDDEGWHAGTTAGICYQLQSDTFHLANSGCDTLVFRVVQAMGADSIVGVTDVGVKLLY